MSFAIFLGMAVLSMVPVKRDAPGPKPNTGIGEELWPCVFPVWIILRERETTSARFEIKDPRTTVASWIEWLLSF